MLRFGIQQVLVPSGMVLVTFLCPVPSSPTGFQGGLSFFNAYPAVFGLVFGFVMRSQRDWDRTGRWVWILPSLVWLWEFSWGIALRPLSYTLIYMFAASGGTEGLPLLLITIPALGSICYSAAIALPRRREHFPIRE